MKAAGGGSAKVPALARLDVRGCSSFVNNDLITSQFDVGGYPALGGGVGWGSDIFRVPDSADGKSSKFGGGSRLPKFSVIMFHPRGVGAVLH